MTTTPTAPSPTTLVLTAAAPTTSSRMVSILAVADDTIGLSAPPATVVSVCVSSTTATPWPRLLDGVHLERRA